MHTGVPFQTNSCLNVQFFSLSASNIGKWKNRMKWITVIIVLALLTAPLKLRRCYKHQLLSILCFFFHKIKIHRWKVEGTSFFFYVQKYFLTFKFPTFFSCEASAKFLLVQLLLTILYWIYISGIVFVFVNFTLFPTICLFSRGF